MSEKVTEDRDKDVDTAIVTEEEVRKELLRIFAEKKALKLSGSSGSQVEKKEVDELPPGSCQEGWDQRNTSGGHRLSDAGIQNPRERIATTRNATEMIDETKEGKTKNLENTGNVLEITSSELRNQPVDMKPSFHSQESKLKDSIKSREEGEPIVQSAKKDTLHAETGCVPLTSIRFAASRAREDLPSTVHENQVATDEDCGSEARASSGIFQDLPDMTVAALTRPGKGDDYYTTALKGVGLGTWKDRCEQATLPDSNCRTWELPQDRSQEGEIDLEERFARLTKMDDADDTNTSLCSFLGTGQYANSEKHVALGHRSGTESYYSQNIGRKHADRIFVQKKAELTTSWSVPQNLSEPSSLQHDRSDPYASLFTDVKPEQDLSDPYASLFADYDVKAGRETATSLSGFENREASRPNTCGPTKSSRHNAPPTSFLFDGTCLPLPPFPLTGTPAIPEERGSPRRRFSDCLTQTEGLMSVKKGAEGTAVHNEHLMRNEQKGLDLMKIGERFRVQKCHVREVSRIPHTFTEHDPGSYTLNEHPGLYTLNEHDRESIKRGRDIALNEHDPGLYTLNEHDRESTKRGRDIATSYLNGKKIANFDQEKGLSFRSTEHDPGSIIRGRDITTSCLTGKKTGKKISNFDQENGMSFRNTLKEIEEYSSKNLQKDTRLDRSSAFSPSRIRAGKENSISRTMAGKENSIPSQVDLFSNFQRNRTRMASGPWSQTARNLGAGAKSTGPCLIKSSLSTSPWNENSLAETKKGVAKHTEPSGRNQNENSRAEPRALETRALEAEFLASVELCLRHLQSVKAREKRRAV